MANERGDRKSRPSYELQAPPTLADRESFPEIHMVKNSYLRAVQRTAISAYLDIVALTGGKPEVEDLDKKENNRRVEIIDTNAESTYRREISKFLFRSHCIDAEGDKEAHPDKLGKAMPTTLGWYGTGDKMVASVSDVVEGTGFASHGRPNAISIIGATTDNGLTKIPENIKYFRKLFASPHFNNDISLRYPTYQNLQRVMRLAQIQAESITVAIMNRKCNETMIREAQEVGTNVVTFDKGDLAWGLKAMLSKPENPIIMMGRGGAPEGSIAAIGARALNAKCELRVMEDEDAQQDFTPIWKASEFVRGAREHSIVIFSTITDNTNFDVKGVEPYFDSEDFFVNSFVIDQNGAEPYRGLQKAA